MKILEFKVSVEPQFSMTKREAFEKLKRWIENNAHTTSSSGFEFKEIKYLGDEE